MNCTATAVPFMLCFSLNQKPAGDAMRLKTLHFDDCILQTDTAQFLTALSAMQVSPPASSFLLRQVAFYVTPRYQYRISKENTRYPNIFDMDISTFPNATVESPL